MQEAFAEALYRALVAHAQIKLRHCTLISAVLHLVRTLMEIGWAYLAGPIKESWLRPPPDN